MQFGQDALSVMLIHASTIGHKITPCLFGSFLAFSDPDLVRVASD